MATRKSADATVPIQRIKDFSAFVRWIERNCGADEILFRGQREDWPLRPELGRIEPRDEVDFQQIERRLIERFKRLARPYLHAAVESEWDWIALARHHGLPTRLLDWTMNPLAALWFAVRKPPTKKEDGSLKPGVVWVFEPRKVDFADPAKHDPYALTRTLVCQPSIVSRRIEAQIGWFTAHFVSAQEGKAGDESISTLDRTLAGRGRLTKLVIAPEIFPDCRFSLDRFGINDLTLFPELDGVGRYAKWLGVFLSDEEIPFYQPPFRYYSCYPSSCPITSAAKA